MLEMRFMILFSLFAVNRKEEVAVIRSKFPNKVPVSTQTPYTGCAISYF
jgi:hypothetical protein